MASENIAAKLVSDLKRDFGLTDAQAAGVVGNLMHESGGFNSLQERNPTSGRGGYGYAQWTGARRNAFENYAAKRGLEPSSYDANYGFLKHELETDPYERRQFNTVKKATTAAEAAKLVSENYLRPGTPNIASRQQYANQALGYAGRPVPPMDIPNTVDSQLDTRRSAPTPASQAPLMAASRAVTSPTGGDTGLQSALNQYATRQANAVTPATRSPQFGPMGVPDTAALYAGIFPQQTQGITPQSVIDRGTARQPQGSLTNPGAINATVNALRQDPTLAAALASRAVPQSQIERSPLPQPAARPRVTVSTPYTTPQRMVGKDGGAARAMPALAAAASAVGGPPTTRVVQSVPVTPTPAPVSASDLARMARNTPAAAPTPAMSASDRARGNPLNMPVSPTPIARTEIVAPAPPNPQGWEGGRVKTGNERLLPNVGLPAAPAAATPSAPVRVAPVPQQRPAAPLMAAIAPRPVVQQRMPLMSQQPLQIQVTGAGLRQPPMTPVQQLQSQGLSPADAYALANMQAAQIAAAGGRYGNGAGSGGVGSYFDNVKSGGNASGNDEPTGVQPRGTIW